MEQPEWLPVTDERGQYVTDEDGDFLVTDGHGGLAVTDGENLYEVDEELATQAAGEAVVSLLDDHPGAADWIQETYGEQTPEAPPPSLSEALDTGLDEALAEARATRDDEGA
jgi:hypothetical protein